MKTIEKRILDFENKLKLRKYSNATTQSYLSNFKAFCLHFNNDIESLKDSEVCKYVLERSENRSHSYQNTLVNAIKFYFEKVEYRKRKFYKIDRPKQISKLPQIVSKEEILDSISKINNLKHKTIISLAFSTGLRVSEICSLKATNIDSKRMLIYVIAGKGRKDRIVPLSQNILELLRKYWIEYKPQEFLFENPYTYKRYSVKSCQEIWKKYKTNSQSTFHTLRHSCFTNLLESGTDVRIIQKIAGHSNIKTTEGYCHVSTNLLNKIQLPL